MIDRFVNNIHYLCLRKKVFKTLGKLQNVIQMMLIMSDFLTILNTQFN